LISFISRDSNLIERLLARLAAGEDIEPSEHEEYLAQPPISDGHLLPALPHQLRAQFDPHLTIRSQISRQRQDSSRDAGRVASVAAQKAARVALIKISGFGVIFDRRGFGFEQASFADVRRRRWRRRLFNAASIRAILSTVVK
jgi:hypothetical protein